MAVDEYFIVRSTQNLLHYGWPRFECGGLYTRGLLLQYLSALLNFLGVNLEVAPRLVSALSSLLALPAVFIIGRRIKDDSLALIAVGILAISVWECEMARFGRMYAPFQAVFLWYVVYFLKRTVDQDRRAEWQMFWLTVVGALLWEGGALLALANFLPWMLQRRSLTPERGDWASLGRFATLFFVVYLFTTSDLRMAGNIPPLPSGYDPDLVSLPSDPMHAPLPVWSSVTSSPEWLVYFLIPLIASAWAIRTFWHRYGVTLTTIGLTAMLVAALAHQFLLVFVLLLLMLVFRFSSRSALASNGGAYAAVAIGVSALFWFTFVCHNLSSMPGTLPWKVLLGQLCPLFSVPNFLDQVARPWARSVPFLGLGLVLLVAVAFTIVLDEKPSSRKDPDTISAVHATSALFVFLLFAVSASGAPRSETRYVFFLYPLAIALALFALITLLEHLFKRRSYVAVASVILSAALFMLSEDFAPRYLLAIDRPVNLLRLNMTVARQSHLIIRDDTPGVAAWLLTNARNDSVIISAYQSLDHYVPNVGYFYVDRSDFNFASYACHRGAVDRWSGKPLLQSIADVSAVIDGSPKSYLVTYTNRVDALIAQLKRFDPQIQWHRGNLSVVALKGKGAEDAPHKGISR